MSSPSERGKLGGKKTAQKGKEYYQSIGKKGGLTKKVKHKPEMPIAVPFNPLMDELDAMLENLK